MDWLVITLKPNQSKKAEENLNNQGFISFFPKITYQSGDKAFIKDLFPGYAFVGYNDDRNFTSINATKGVSKILQINQMMPLVKDSLIIKIQEQIKQLNSEICKEKLFQKHEKVTLKLKFFNNQEAEVIEIRNTKDSQKVLLQILNSSHSFWTDCKNISSKIINHL